MIKSFSILALSFLISCGSGSDKAPSSDKNQRYQDILNIEVDGYAGEVFNFTGMYDGACRGSLDGEALKECEISVDVIQSSNNMTLQIYFSGIGLSAGYNIENLNVKGNSIYAPFSNEIIGEIGKSALKIKEERYELKFLKGKKGKYYFDGVIDGSYSGSVEGELRKRK